MRKDRYVSRVAVTLIVAVWLLGHGGAIQALGALTVTGVQSTTTNVATDGSSMANINIVSFGNNDWACWTNVVAAAQQKAGGTAIGELQCTISCIRHDNCLGCSTLRRILAD